MSECVTVIVPTLARAQRRQSLLRALESVVSQSGHPAKPLVVINGDVFDPSLVDDLLRWGAIQVRFLKRANLAAAMRTGRQYVDTEFFAFLDDDDEYSPDAFAERVSIMRLQPEIDVLVGNGFREYLGTCRAVISDVAGVSKEPLTALLSGNWLASCAGLYRSSRIHEHYFELPDYFEWTYLAYSLCLTRRVSFVENGVYVVHDTDNSLSKSDGYHAGQARIVELLLELELPAKIKRGLKVRYGSALHALADRHRVAGDYQKAWLLHLRSLLQPSGIRYALYTRKLFGL